MTAVALTDALDVLVDAPSGIDRLRRLIVQLAVRGRLVPQDAEEDPASTTLEVIRTEKGDRLSVKVRGRPVIPRVPEDWECPESPPNGWDWARLDDTGEYVNGLAFKSSDWTNSGLPIIRIQNLSDPTKEFNYAQGDYPADRRVTTGDLLVSWSATLDVFQWEGGEALVNQHIFKVIPDERLVHRPFLYLLLRDTIRDMAESEKAHGLVMKHINRGPFLSHAVLIPPLAEQHRIVAHVDELMALLDRLEAAKEARDATRAQLRDAALAALQDANDAEEVKTAWSRIADHMHDLFTDAADIPPLRLTILQLAARGRVVPQMQEEGGASDLLDSIGEQKAELVKRKEIRRSKGLPTLSPEDEPYDLPESWRWCRLGTIALRLSYGTAKKSLASGRVPVLRMGNLQDGRIDWTNLKYTSDEKDIEQYSLSPGSVLFNRTNSPALVGKTGIYRGERPAIFAGYLIHVDLPDRVDPEYINIVLNTPMAREWCWHVKSDGVSQSNISGSKLATFALPLPPPDEQRRISAQVQRLMVIVDRLEDRLLGVRELQESFCASAVRALPAERHGVEECSAVAVG